jgi:NAD(P)-dependent dehydrogenase (short-subunit alcohol dehydrogenase family)
MRRHDRRIAFITGANRGIGRETARELGELGFVVLLGTRDVTKGEAAAADLVAAGIDATAIHFDALRPETFDAVYEFVAERFGRLDLLVNNAAIHPGAPAHNTATSIGSDLLRDIFETNFIAVVALTQRLLPLLERAPSGRIINVSSIVGSLTLQRTPDTGIEDAKDLGYNASKTALNAFTVHLAHELRNTRITVHSVDPGWVKTEMSGPRATLELSEGGRSCAYVASLPADTPSGTFSRGPDPLPW